MVQYGALSIRSQKVSCVYSVRRIGAWIIAFWIGLIIGIFVVIHIEQISTSNNGKYIQRGTSADQSLAQQLYDEVRVLCYVQTTPENHEKRAKHVKNTWGKRCNKLLFMSSALDPELGTVALQVKEERQYLWNKTKEGFKYIYAHHFHEADWFLKVDDDAFVFLENLRRFLYPYSAKMPIHFGHKYNISGLKKGYFAGGPGYVLSKEALRQFIEIGLPDNSKCPSKPEGSEDLNMGMCLEKIGVIAGDSRVNNRETFFPFRMDSHLLPRTDLPDDFWYYDRAYYPIHDGLDCCTKDTIAFHYIDSTLMYVVDFLAYTFRPFGVPTEVEDLPRKLEWDEVLRGLDSFKKNDKQELVSANLG